jgi:beta-glucanase (GH16 family)
MLKHPSRVGSFVAPSLALLLAAISSPTTTAADLLRDDFNGSSLNSSNWGIGTWWLGRTQLGNTPQITGGLARLKLDTYNPTTPGTFRGSEIWSNTQFARGTNGLELEARVRVNTVPNGLVTSFFTYAARLNFNPPLADEIDFEHVSNTHNAAPAGSKPILLTTWNDFRTDGSNFWDPNVHNSTSVVVPGLDLAQFNTYRIRWLANRVEWYVNGQLLRTATQAVSTDPMNVRLNFWAPASDWPAAHSASLVPVTSAAANTSYLYDVDFVAVREAYQPVAATATNRLFTDRFKNTSVTNSDSINGFWNQRNVGSSTVTESASAPKRLAAAGSGFPHAQVASTVRSEFNFFSSPLRITADGIDIQSTAGTSAKSILRFVLASQSLAAGSESEYTTEDALALRIQGDNRIVLGYKLDQTNTNTEFRNLVLDTSVTGPVRRFTFTFSPLSYSLNVEHELSPTDGTRTTTTFTGALNLPLANWRLGTLASPTGQSALFIQGQLNNSGAGENMTASVDSLAVDAVRSRWATNNSGSWTTPANWSADGVPNFPGANAQLTSAISAPRTVTVNTPTQLGVLQLDSPHRYTLTGSPLTLITPAASASIDLLSGSHTISAPLVLASPTTVSMPSAASVLTTAAISGTATLTKTGPGRLEATSLTLPSLTLSAGTLDLLPSTSLTSRLDSLSIAPAARLNLSNDLLINYTGQSPLAQLIAYFQTDLLTAPTSANSLPTTLAIAESADLGLTDFAGLPIDNTTVILKFTYVGDANLDGQVDALDYERIDLAIGNTGALGTAQGDLNYDGDVDALDYEQVDLNIGNGVGSPLASVFIPEPATLAPLVLLPLLSSRRRKVG